MSNHSEFQSNSTSNGNGTGRGNPTYSFVMPVYNEEEVLPEVYKTMTKIIGLMDGPAEVILVNDGSKDGSYPLLVEMTQSDDRFKVIDLSRNFGHQTAITAGIDYARGDAVIIMDADLQDPPEVALDLAKKWREGFDIVYAVRKERKGESLFKIKTSAWFYRLLNKLSDIQMPLDVGDFRLVDRRALESFKALRESNRYVRGMFTWIGYKQAGVEFTREERFAGTTKYPMARMLKLAKDGIISFSDVPLKMALKAGFIISGLSLCGGVAVIILKLANFYVVPGWTSLACLVAFLGGAQLIVMGIMGEYIGRVYEEVKNRPLYVVNKLHNLSIARPNDRIIAPGAPIGYLQPNVGPQVTPPPVN